MNAVFEYLQVVFCKCSNDRGNYPVKIVVKILILGVALSGPFTLVQAVWKSIDNRVS